MRKPKYRAIFAGVVARVVVAKSPKGELSRDIESLRGHSKQTADECRIENVAFLITHHGYAELPEYFQPHLTR